MTENLGSRDETSQDRHGGDIDDNSLPTFRAQKRRQLAMGVSVGVTALGLAVGGGLLYHEGQQLNGQATTLGQIATVESTMAKIGGPNIFGRERNVTLPSGKTMDIFLGNRADAISASEANAAEAASLQRHGEDGELGGGLMLGADLGGIATLGMINLVSRRKDQI